jgi:2-iminobutanoate/2-iminopropanoate deaminase
MRGEMKKTISTDKAPAAIGPYSQAIWGGDLLFISGQLPLVPETSVFPGDDVIAQTRQVLTNVRGVLESAGLDFPDVLKATVYLSNMNDFESMNSVYSEFFPTPQPARAVVEVARLPKDALVEIEVIAMKSGQ